jgi:hypothetical protein
LARLIFPTEKGAIHKRLDAVVDWLEEKGDQQGGRDGDQK